MRAASNRERRRGKGVVGLARARPAADARGDGGGRGRPARAGIRDPDRGGGAPASALGAAGALTIGIGVTAYTLGLRHAFDADHISAIDNTTRKLMAEGKRPLSVGFWFSLGHSTIVFALAFLISVGVRALDGPVRQPTARSCTSVTSCDRHRASRAGSCT